MDFSKLKEYLELLVSSTGGIDTQIKVFYKDLEVFSFCGGFRDQNHLYPASENDCFNLYSLSKPITCTAAMQLVERGLLKLDAPVSDYLPFFKDLKVSTENGVEPLNEELLVWHLFAMQAGFNYDNGGKEYNRAVENNASTMEIMKTIAKEIPLSFRPGEHWQYACRSHDAIGCIIEVVTGMSFPQYLEKNIFTPLNMEHIGFIHDEHISKNIADMYRRDKGTEFIKQPVLAFRGPCENYKSGAYGLMGDINSYAKFARAMANGGKSTDGAHILDISTINIMRADRLTDKNRNDFWRSPFGYGYGLGVRTLVSKDAGSPSPIGEFGWDGAAGGYTLFDTENKIAVVFLTHALSGNEKLDQHTIRDLVYEGIMGDTDVVL